MKRKKKNNIAIILPAFNEAKVLRKTLTSLTNELKKDKNHHFTLIVIDDGSTDKTKSIASNIADVVLHHRINRGLGAALATGLEYVRRSKSFDYAITFDSDGQHNPKDIKKAILALNKGYDVVIGSRFLSKNHQFPKFRKLILQVSNLITFLFFHVWTTDSQSGFRGFNQKAINTIKIRTNKMEVSSEFFAEIKKNHLKFTEIPIKVKYTKYSLSKGQSNSNSFLVLIKLLYKLAK